MIKNTILRVLTAVAWISFTVGVSGLDSPNFTIPTIMMLAGITWIALFGYANGWTK